MPCPQLVSDVTIPSVGAEEDEDLDLDLLYSGTKKSSMKVDKGFALNVEDLKKAKILRNIEGS